MKNALFLAISLLTISPAFAGRKVLTGTAAAQRIEKLHQTHGSSFLSRNVRAEGLRETVNGRGQVRASGTRATMSPLVAAQNEGSDGEGITVQTQKERMREQTQTQETRTREKIRQAYAARLDAIYGEASYNKSSARNPAFNPNTKSSWLELMLLSEVYARLEMQSRSGFQDTSKQELGEILATLTALNVRLSSLLPPNIQNIEVYVNKLQGQNFTLASVLDQIQDLKVETSNTEASDTTAPSKTATPVAQHGA